MNKENRRLKVVIPEPIPSLNKGELAILEGIRASLNVYGEYSLTLYAPSCWLNDEIRNSGKKYRVVSGLDLFNLAYAFSDNSETLSKMHFFKTWGKLLFFSLIIRMSKKTALFYTRDPLLKSFAEADLIIAGHDGMLSYNHFYLVLAARIMKKSIALFGGSNDLKGRSRFKIRKYFQFAINNSILCTVRDPGIRDYLIINDIASDKVHLFPDPAVLLKPCDDRRVSEILTKEGVQPLKNRPLYGLIPVRGGVVYNKSFSDIDIPKEKHQLRVELWVEIMMYLIETTDAYFIFLPHCIGPVRHDDDRLMSKDIYDGIKDGKERITLIENEYSAGELKGLMKNFDFVLGERTHGLIGSVSVATPCIALTVKEDLRMHYIMEDMFDRKTFDLNNPDISKLKKLLSDEWSNRKQIALQMQDKAKQIKREALKAAKLLAEKIKQNITK